MFLFDSHCDTPSQLLRLRDLSVDNRYGHVDIPKMKKGDVGASFFALFSPISLSEEQADAHALAMVAAVKEAVRANSGSIASATSCEDILQNHSKGLISILLGMENGSPIGKSLERLEYYFDQGVRYLTLTHNADNAIADSAAGNRTWGGLSPFGKEVVATMDRLGMMIDLSHSSDETFWDVVGLSERPPMASHSCCRALCGHRRNLTDDMLRALGERDGYIGINFYPAFLSEKFGKGPGEEALLDEADEAESRFIEDPSDPVRRRTYEGYLDRLELMWRPGAASVADHIDRAVSIAGLDHIGIGTDFDGICVGPTGLEDISKMHTLEEELMLRGYDRESVAKIFGVNLLEYFKRVSK